MPFEEIAPIVGRTPAASRQLASRARRRVRGAPVPDVALDGQWRVVSAFLAASREGEAVRRLPGVRLADAPATLRRRFAGARVMPVERAMSIVQRGRSHPIP